MSIKWKNGQRFNPTVILEKIDQIRSVGADGGVSFSGIVIDEYLPTLESHINFPRIADYLDTSTLVWKALAKADAPLSRDSFMKVLNNELSNMLSTREKKYVLVTSMSIAHEDIPKTLTREEAKINFWPSEYPPRFLLPRRKLLEELLVVDATPLNYCKVTVEVKAKSANSAVYKAMRVLDVQRALWCLMANPVMQMVFGNASIKPINSVRLGNQHSLHEINGEISVSTIWYEPGFQPTIVARLNKPEVVLKNSRLALRRMASSAYGELLLSSLVRYVRALDESNANTAFLRLWGALEALTTPGKAHYDDVVKRCAFLYKDGPYHRQVLEHLREYRNASVHAGEESDKARTHCFQLQGYFRSLFWFHLRNANFFKSLDEANLFLDSADSPAALMRQIQVLQKAFKYKSS